MQYLLKSQCISYICSSFSWYPCSVHEYAYISMCTLLVISLPCSFHRLYTNQSF